MYVSCVCMTERCGSCWITTTRRYTHGHINSYAMTFNVSRLFFFCFFVFHLSICHNKNAWRKNAIEWKSANRPMCERYIGMRICIDAYIIGSWNMTLPFKFSIFFVLHFFFFNFRQQRVTQIGQLTEICEGKKNQRKIYLVFKWFSVFIWFAFGWIDL